MKEQNGGKEFCYDSSEEIEKNINSAVHRFASNILNNIQDSKPEFSKTVDEHFWDLI